jgi:fructokinase
MGHIRVPHDWADDPFAGSCYAHGDCWEGLAAGYAIEQRWEARGEDLPAGHPAWEMEARYLALGIATLTCTLSPERIVIGGGVMRQVGFEIVRGKVVELLNGYTAAPQIIPPALGADSGVLGAIALTGT